MKKVKIIYIGEFSKKIASILANKDSEFECERYEEKAIDLENYCGVVFLSDVPYRNKSIKLNQACVEHKKFFLSGFFINNFYYVTPKYDEASESCISCFYQRYLQHSDYGGTEKNVLKFFDNNDNVFPLGYLPSDARLIANYLSKIMNENGVEFNGIFCLNSLTKDTKILFSPGINDCNLCGLYRDKKNRSYKMIENYVKEELLNE